MMSLSKTEAKIINYLYQHGQEYRYAAEIARDLGIKRRTIYDSLDSLEQKGIVRKQSRGRMRFYTLGDKWRDVTEAVKASIAETDERSSPQLRQYAADIKKARALIESILPLENLSVSDKGEFLELTGRIPRKLFKKLVEKKRNGETKNK